MSEATYLIKQGKEFQTFQSKPEDAVQQAQKMNSGHILLYRLVAIIEEQKVPERKVTRYE